MPVPQNKTNFKTYDASTRLLAAVVASIKGKARLDFNEVAALMGGGTTASAVDHRLRPIKQLGKLQVKWHEGRRDPGELPVDPAEIHKLFGESTPQGLEWHFRGVKALGRSQEAAVEEGKDPSKLTFESTSRARGAGAATPKAGTKRKRGGAAASSGGGRKKPTMSEEETGDTGFESDYDAKDVNVDDEEKKEDTPTPTPKRRNARGASSAAKAKSKPATPASATSKKNGNTAGVARTLFGNGINATSDDEIRVLDLSDDMPPPRKTPARPAQVKQEPQPEEEVSFNESGTTFGEDEDELADGEI